MMNMLLNEADVIATLEMSKFYRKSKIRRDLINVILSILVDSVKFNAKCNDNMKH